MMGAGKSSVAAELGRRLGLPVFDTDARVEAEARMSIPQIFEREGEAGFRRRERAAIEGLAGSAAVVALGGGAMAQPGAPELLRAHGTVVYLRASAETLARRVGRGDSRPLLAGLDPAARRAKLAELLAARAPAYERAHFAVDTDALSVSGVVEAALRAVEKERA